MKIFHKQFNLFYKEKKLQFNYSFNVDTTFQELLEYVIKLFPNFNFCPCFNFSNMNDEKINNDNLLYNSKDIYNDFKISNFNPDSKCLCSDIKNFYYKSKKKIIEYFLSLKKKLEDSQKKIFIHNNSFNQIKSKDFYDIIIDIKSIKDIKNGWEIKMSKEGLIKYNKYQKDKDKFIRVGFIGNKSKGKSFLLSKLSKIELPNNFIETKGLSIKYPEILDNKHSKIVFLDTEGFDNHILGFDNSILINDKEHKIQNENKVELEIKNDKLITELFLQNYIFYNTDIIILVIGYLSFSELKLLNRIMSLMKKEKCKKPLYIIHNLKLYSSIEQVKEYIKEYLILNSPFDLDKGEVISNDKNNGIYFYEKNSQLNVYHLIMAKEGSEAGDFYNKFTLTFLENSYIKVVNIEYFDVIKSIKESFIDISKKILEINDKKQNSLIIDDFYDNNKDNKYIKLKDEKKFILKDFIINESNYFISDINAFAPPYKVFKPKNEDKIIIKIEVPGRYTIKCKISYEIENTIITLEGKKRKDIEQENNTDHNIYNTRKFGYFYLDIPLNTEKYPINIYPKIYNFKGIIILEFRLKKKDEENYLIYEGEEEQSETQLKSKENNSNNIIVNIKDNNANIKELNDKINKMEKIINDNINNDKKIIELMNIIQKKDNEITELKLSLPFDLKKGEKLMSIIITSYDQKINCPFICKNTDKFNKIENLLYEKYPKYSEIENFFVINGNRINKSLNLEENKIKDKEIITLIPIDY